MRKTAREIAFKLIYENLFVDGKSIDEESFLSLTEEAMGITDEDQKFIRDIFENYFINKEIILNSISSKLVNFTLERIASVDKAILCLAIAEIEFYKLTDYRIVINEAVELAKKYSSEKSPKFVNGVLSKIVSEK